MTQSLDNISQLLPLLETVFQAEQLKMAKVNARISALKKQLSDLDRPPLADSMSVATIAGADLRWQTWVQQRKGLINQELALAMRDRAAVRSGMVTALSKLEAARQMHARVQINAHQIAARRASW